MERERKKLMNVEYTSFLCHLLIPITGILGDNRVLLKRKIKSAKNG